MLLLHNSFLFSFFFTQRVQHDFIYFVRGAQLFVRYPAYMLPGCMPGASQRSTQHICRVPHREVGPITSLGGTQHICWVPHA